MIISRKKYEKLNDDLIDAKAKVDDAKKSLDEENKSMRATLLIKKQRDQYKTERDTLIDDIAVLKANISRYRNRAENAMQLAESENCEVLRLERANAELMVVSDLYKTLTNHIRLKAEANPGVSRYIDLVNYIDRLESADDEKI